MKVLHVPCYHKNSVLPVLEKYFSLIQEYKSIGLISTAQHLNQLEAVRKFLHSKGLQVFIGGQVLGCNQKNALKIEKKVDAFLFIGSGLFHPVGVSIKSGKPVILLNPYSNSMELLSNSEKEKWLKRQKGRIMKMLEASVFGIIVSTKSGQFDLKKAFELKKKFESKEKKAFVFAGEELNPGNLLPFKVDCWVNTACPRIADDSFDKPAVNASEVDLV